MAQEELAAVEAEAPIGHLDLKGGGGLAAIVEVLTAIICEQERVLLPLRTL